MIASTPTAIASRLPAALASKCAVKLSYAERCPRAGQMQVALVRRAGKFEIVVGSKKIAASKGTVVETVYKAWSQIARLVIARDASGFPHLSTLTAAEENGWTV